MADVIQVSFEGDESSLAAAIEAAKRQLASLDQATIETGRKLAEAFKITGRDPASIFPMMAAENQRALAAYMATVEKVKDAIRGLSGATNEMGGAFRVGGVNIESMMTRMGARMA